jgi:hypothetical protein
VQGQPAGALSIGPEIEAAAAEAHLQRRKKDVVEGEADP